MLMNPNLGVHKKRKGYPGQNQLRMGRAAPLLRPSPLYISRRAQPLLRDDLRQEG